MRQPHLLIPCLALLVAALNVNDVLAQGRATRATIDSLRMDYCALSKERSRLERQGESSLLPPSPFIKCRTNFHCKRFYNIPDSLLATLYPFNADSIRVYSHLDGGDSLRFFGALSPHHVRWLADMFYNYNYKRSAQCSTISSVGSGQLPDLVMLFHHATDTIRLELYTEEDDYPYWIVNDDLQDIYWGENCLEWKQMLMAFFKEYFDYTIERRFRSTQFNYHIERRVQNKDTI